MLQNRNTISYKIYQVFLQIYWLSIFIRCCWWIVVAAGLFCFVFLHLLYAAHSLFRFEGCLLFEHSTNKKTNKIEKKLFRLTFLFLFAAYVSELIVSIYRFRSFIHENRIFIDLLSSWFYLISLPLFLN